MNLLNTMSTIKAIEVAYTRTKEYIVYDAFSTIMVAIVLFLIFHKLYDEYQKLMSKNNGRFSIADYWINIRIYLLVLFISTSAGQVLSLTESICTDMQTVLIAGTGYGSHNDASRSMANLIKRQRDKTQSGFLDVLMAGVLPMFYVATHAVSATLMAIGVFIFKHAYTFFILSRYMWLLMLELVAPIAICLSIHSATRSHFYAWLKNMIICYLLIPMFLLADHFSNEAANFYMEGTEAFGEISVILIVAVGVWTKIKMFTVVRSKSSQLF